MVSKSQFSLICSFLHLLLNPHKSFHVGEELIIFLLFECGIKLYMLAHVSWH
jgi:hypothetical protein